MIEESSIHNNGFRRQIAWTALVILLFLRIPYTIFIIYYLPIENQIGPAIYEVGTYFLTGFLIGWERKRLSEFHIDPLALTFIIFLRPIQTLILKYWNVESPLAFPHPLGLSLWGISIGMVIALLKSGFKPSRISSQEWKWLAVGLVLGIGVSVIDNSSVFLSGLQNKSATGSPTLLGSSSMILIYHLGFAPINEEPLFRGFLWGYLRQSRWKDIWILLFQTLLFMVAHVYFANQYPLRFWIFIPGSALLLGVLTWRARSIGPAIFAHGLINGSVYVLLLNFFYFLR